MNIYVYWRTDHGTFAGKFAIVGSSSSFFNAKSIIFNAKSIMFTTKSIIFNTKSIILNTKLINYNTQFINFNTNRYLESLGSSGAAHLPHSQYL